MDITDEGRTPAPGIVPGAGPFDLNDFRSQVGQRLGGHRSREHARQIENPDALQGATHVVGSTSQVPRR
jgi:hypothetical protein